MSEYPLWSDASSRAVEVMGGEGIKYVRAIEDKVTLVFKPDEWRKLFNIDSAFIPCSAEWNAYSPDRAIHISFMRVMKEEKK